MHYVCSMTLHSESDIVVGSEAAEKIFDRDARKKAAKAKSAVVGKGKQMVTKRGRK